MVLDELLEEIDPGQPGVNRGKRSSRRKQKVAKQRPHWRFGGLG